MSFEEAEKVFGLFLLHIKRAEVYSKQQGDPIRLWDIARCLVFMSDDFTFEHEMIVLKWNGTNIIVYDNPSAWQNKVRLQIGIYFFDWF